MKPVSKLVISLVTLVTLAGIVRARILASDDPNNQTPTTANPIRLFTSAALKHPASHLAMATACKWPGKLTYWWPDEIKFLCDGFGRSDHDDLGRTPRQAPPSPRAAPGSRP